MRLVVIGVNHKTAPVALRERLALVGDDVNVALKQIEAFTDGSVIVSTCNRTEIYALVPHTSTSHHANGQLSDSQLSNVQDVKAAGQSSNNTFSSSMNISSAAISAHITKRSKHSIFGNSDIISTRNFSYKLKIIIYVSINTRGI